jgi:cyclopropane fatty-acyl-phospholipid synthase-like methyltransferase
MRTVALAAASILILGAIVAQASGGGSYKGRQLAAPMSYRGAPWLVRGTREAEERTSELFRFMALGNGMTACDIGVGNGYHALPMAEMVGPEGTVYGVDIQREMLTMLADRASAAGLDNVRPVLSTDASMKLPSGVCDAALLVDVYHEFSDPKAMLAELRQALAPSGKMYVVEFRAEDPEVAIKPEHKMTKQQVVAEIAEGGHGLKLVDQYDGLPIQHVLVFQRDDGPDAPVQWLPWNPTD